MKAIICEDERYWCNTIIKLLSAWAAKREIDLVYNCFSKPKETIDYLLCNQDIDVLFLDIALGDKEINGMTIAKLIWKQRSSIPIIFVTADDGNAVDGYLVGAVGYLKKPIDQKRFYLFLNRIVKQTTPRTIYLMSESGLILLPENELNYVEVRDHIIYYHTIRGIIQLKDTLSNVIEKLGSENFVQVHKSYIVSKHKIDCIKTTYPYSIDIHTGSDIKQLPVGRKYKDNLLEIYTNDVLEQMI